MRSLAGVLLPFALRHPGGIATLAVMLIACGSKDAGQSSHAVQRAGASTSTSPYADTVSIDARVDSIDTFLASHPDRVKLFATLPDDSVLVAVKDSTSWPDETDATYNIGFDSTDRPIIHIEMPTSQSGDWFAVARHWFAPDGRTILYEFNISGFGSGCGEILRETWRVYLDPGGRIMKESRRYTDEKDAPVKADDCYRRSENAPPPKRTAAELPFPR